MTELMNQTKGTEMPTKQQKYREILEAALDKSLREATELRAKLRAREAWSKQFTEVIKALDAITESEKMK